MWQLSNGVRYYPWGSRTVIPELLGDPVPADRPHAELWVGAHPDEPSTLSDGRPLDKAIAEDPDRLLGPAVVERFGARLPFLLKVLAADTPLSLQAHPTTAQAEVGYAAEEAAGIPHDDPTRTFKDPFHKPELLLALTTFEALCGFRPVEESLHCLAKLQVPELKPTIAALARGGLRAAIPQLLALTGERRTELVHAVATAAARFVAAADPEFINTYRWAATLAETYPGDPGVVISLMCNHLKLAPGEAVFLPAGNLHAYLSGAGVEVMASSDNVLRGGLTAKHVDLAALIEVLDFTDGRVPVIHPVLGPGGLRYPVPVQDFDLTRVHLDEQSGTLTTRGPQLLLCTEGTAVLASVDGELTLEKGRAAFLPAGEPVTARGPAVLYRATTNLS
ncbi:mannose-6-phosphate isomerase, class I [Blastococcus sp. MG754426]|uniref:mannose-6-phosphate isomerase, class I n=1 Tax=unclassified Blastococcus TaxID=2619396 RepID=UPI001EF0CA2E|nr:MULTISPECIES: mannose-6-phosphate isomerase, class I [unclassified Blastococcus]MCF6507184.1 mannose-6-phosphate isomerase, class I [Blastococcus sp. MG754426]MCF6512690.1 mannose-6-phosphate isomerase, class I [Blastococcus sp. MG754427]MCF6735459.1 mannose-6-phosphate isomerase, class I [Blastococcus sp. KM273129]